MALTLGNSPEYSPIYKWRATQYGSIPRVIASIETTLTGKTRAHVLKDGSNNPIVWEDARYRIIIEAENSQTLAQRYDTLKDMMGQVVKFVPHDHVADGADHTTYVRNMFLQEVGELEPLSPILSRFYSDIFLVDASTF